MEPKRIPTRAEIKAREAFLRNRIKERTKLGMIDNSPRASLFNRIVSKVKRFLDLDLQRIEF